MEFDVTNLDKILLIKTLYAHADPKGVGKAEYKVRKVRGENVIGLTDDECIEILKMDHPDSNFPLIDYHNGKPIKLDFNHQPNGKIFIDTCGYDSRHGRYRFLEALLNVFDLDEIIFVKKEYPDYLADMIEECTNRPIEETILLKNIVKHTIKHTDKGIYWIIDTDSVNYKPPFMREF